MLTVYGYCVGIRINQKKNNYFITVSRVAFTDAFSVLKEESTSPKFLIKTVIFFPLKLEYY